MFFNVPALFGTNNFVLIPSHLYRHFDINGNLVGLSGTVAQTINEKCKTFADVAELLTGKEIVVKIIPYKRLEGNRVVDAHTLRLDWVE